MASTVKFCIKVLPERQIIILENASFPSLEPLVSNVSDFGKNIVLVFRHCWSWITAISLGTWGFSAGSLSSHPLISSSLMQKTVSGLSLSEVASVLLPVKCSKAVSVIIFVLLPWSSNVCLKSTQSFGDEQVGVAKKCQHFFFLLMIALAASVAEAASATHTFIAGGVFRYLYRKRSPAHQYLSVSGRLQYRWFRA